MMWSKAIVFLSLLILAAGCVQRTMTIESNPPGALVFLNDQEVGRTPLTREFVWYGNYDIQLRKEGYVSISTNQPVIAPWWQWVPFDFFAEFIPGAKDHQTFNFTMRPASTQPANAEEMLQSAHGMKSRLESSERPKPAK